MSTSIRLQRYQIADLQRIRDAEIASLQDAARKLREIDPLPLRPEELHAALLPIFANPDLAESVLRELLALAGLMRQRGVDVKDLLVGLRRALQDENGWGAAEIAKWSQAEPVLEQMLNSTSVRVVSKAIELSYEYANLLQRARIITDIRPIFDVDAKSIVASVVSHTLRIRYDGADGSHSLSIAMDKADIESLADQCARALRKANLSKACMEKVDLPTMISGERIHESN